MRKKKIALAYGITGGYVDILANVLIGLKHKSKKFWNDIIVFHEGITEEQKKHLNKIVECKFIELKARDFLKNVPRVQLELYSVATFFRFESFSLLDDYEKVIWSDVDVLYQKDISELTKFGDKTGYAATYASEPYIVENNFFELINEYNMFIPMINAGLFVISDKLKNYKEIQKWCYESTIKYGSKLRWLDQAILNIMVQKFNIEIEPIDLNKFHCHPTVKEYRKNACIIHAHGLRKFWNDLEFQQLFPEWYKNHNEWLKLYPHQPTKLIYDYLPLVSVVMSVYERYDFLVEAVESILKQTYKNLELIIVVEKSDNQKKINKVLEELNNKKIKIINNTEKLGFSNSLNVGIKASKGKYIARMDDDDISLPTRIEKQVQFMENNLEIGICDTNAEFFMYGRGLWYYTNPTSEELKALLLVTNPICHPSVMMRKSMLDEYKLKYNPDYFSEDYELWSRSIAYFPIAHIDEVLLKYRASKKNVTSIEANDSKIQTSIKKTIKHQFKDYLDLDFNDNEIELLQRRINIIDKVACRDSAIKLQKQTYKRIIQKNKECKIYNQEFIEQLFPINEKYQKKSAGTKKSRIKNVIKRILKPIYTPIYNAIERRVYGIVANQCNSINYRLDLIQNQLETINNYEKKNMRRKITQKGKNHGEK